MTFADEQIIYRIYCLLDNDIFRTSLIQFTDITIHEKIPFSFGIYLKGIDLIINRMVENDIHSRPIIVILVI